MSQRCILVIKHGSLGDFIMLTPAFKAIRQHHANAHIILMTAKPYASMAKKMPYFDRIWIDNREKFYKLPNLLRGWRMLNGANVVKRFDRIYDLQASSRTNLYFKLLKKPKPEWVGTAKGCAFLRPFPPNIYHPAEIHQRHLATVGIKVETSPDISWMKAGISQLVLPKRFVCLIPSCSIQHKVKRWSAAGYVKLIHWLASKGISSVLIGTDNDKPMIEAIKRALGSLTHCIDCCGKTSFEMIAEVARQSLAVIGSDTGPMHIAAATGTNTLILFSKQSKPAHLCAPKGDHVNILEHHDLEQLPVSTVQQHCDAYLNLNTAEIV
tara:strand:+ start:2710 stop:3681 length:972 start_codon:yes stop_codon:yes gene_type:complete